MKPIQITFDPASLSLVMHGLQLVAQQATAMGAQMQALAIEAQKPDEAQEPEKAGAAE